MSRVLTANVLALLLLSDWVISFFNPQQNMGLWLAAAGGAFVIRFAYPQMPTKQSVSGWLVGVILALLFGSSAVKSGKFDYLEPAAIWGTIALLGDLAIQIIAWFIKLFRKLGGYTLEHPGQALDEGTERVEKLVNLWIRIKVPFLDIIDTVTSRFKKP